MIKRILVINLIIVLSVSMMTGCMFAQNPQKEEAPAAGSAQPVDPEAYSDIAGKYTMVAWLDADGDYLKFLVSEGIKGEDLFIELEKDGTYVWDMSAANEWVDRGTYIVTGNDDIVLTYSGGEDWLRIDGDRIFFFAGDDRLSFKKVVTAESPEPDIDPDREYNDTYEIKEFERKLAEIAGPPKGKGGEELYKLFTISDSILREHEDIVKNSESWSEIPDTFGISIYKAGYKKQIKLFGKPTEVNLNIEDKDKEFEGKKLGYDTIFNVAYHNKKATEQDVDDALAMVFDSMDLFSREPGASFSVSGKSVKLDLNESEIRKALAMMKEVGEFESGHVSISYPRMENNGGWTGFQVAFSYRPSSDETWVGFNLFMASLKNE